MILIRGPMTIIPGKDSIPHQSDDHALETDLCHLEMDAHHIGHQNASDGGGYTADHPCGRKDFPYLYPNAFSGDRVIGGRLHGKTNLRFIVEKCKYHDEEKGEDQKGDP
jgi:hypothetical protein